MCRCLNAIPQFENYINNLDHYFFDALGNVTHLAIIGHEEGAIGQDVYWQARLPLRTTHVPKLKKLELGYCSIQDDLLDFLVAHSSTLEGSKLFVVPTDAVCRLSTLEFSSCRLSSHEHLAKYSTASHIQQKLSCGSQTVP